MQLRLYNININTFQDFIKIGILLNYIKVKFLKYFKIILYKLYIIQFLHKLNLYIKEFNKSKMLENISLSSLSLLENSDIEYFRPSNHTHLKKAKLVSIIGEGGFSNIKLYQCKETKCNHDGNICNKIFIVKKMELDIEQWAKQTTSIKTIRIQKIMWNEFNIGKTLDHPNINKVLDIIPSSFSIVLDYFSAIDMLEYLNMESNKDINTMLNYYNQLLDAVEYLHSNGVSHMDIKLENVLVNLCTNQVKLIDFGQSKIFINKYNNTYIKSNEICGTEIYFPPEFYTQLCYNPDKVDVWCCGIILYNIIYNYMPWESASNQDKRFYQFKSDYQYNKLHPTIFPYCEWSDVNLDVLSNIFLNVFAIDYNKRCNIDYLVKKTRLLLT